MLMLVAKVVKETMTGNGRDRKLVDMDKGKAASR